MKYSDETELYVQKLLPQKVSSGIRNTGLITPQQEHCILVNTFIDNEGQN